MTEDPILFWPATFLLCHHQHLLLPFCQMWGDSRSHIDLSTGGGEDPPAVIFPQLLCVWSSAQCCQWRQCGPYACAWSPAFPQVGICYIKIDFHLDKHKYCKWETVFLQLYLCCFRLFCYSTCFWRHLQKHCSFGTSAPKLMQILDFFASWMTLSETNSTFLALL